MTASPSNSLCALVVDDDFLIRMDTVDILESVGFRVLEAEHGDAAHDLLMDGHPEVVLVFTDVQMPGELDGFSLARCVASTWPHISIIVASGHIKPEPGAMPENVRFIDKPFSAELVRAHLDELLPERHKPELFR